MIVAGIGCRRGAASENICVALDSALAQNSVASHLLELIAIPEAKRNERGVTEAAALRGVPVVLISQYDLELMSRWTLTRSGYSLAALNVNSVAEAAALCGAGLGARLLAPRIVVGSVTCALAEGGIVQ